MIFRFLRHPFTRSYLSLALVGGVLLSVAMFIFEVYVTMTGSLNHNFCRAVDGMGGLSIGDGDSCFIHWDYVALLFVYWTGMFGLWSIFCVLVMVAGWLILRRLKPGSTGKVNDRSTVRLNIFPARGAASMLYLVVVFGFTSFWWFWYTSFNPVILIYMLPALLLAFPLLASIRYLASRR